MLIEARTTQIPVGQEGERNPSREAEYRLLARDFASRRFPRR